MTEKKVRVKIKSSVSDITAANLGEQIVREFSDDAMEFTDDMKEKIEYSTEGVLRDKGKTIELCYDESSDMGMDNTTTTLIFEKGKPNLLNMVRTGENTAGLVFSDTLKRQPCAYNIGGFPIEFSVYTRSIDNAVTMHGGTINLDYLIEIRGSVTERNEFTIRVDEVRGR